MSSILIFIVPALIFAFAFTSDKLRYFKLYTVPKLSTVIVSAILMVAALPLINWMIEFNGSMVFPEFLAGVEQWMRTAESNAEMLTGKFLEMDNILDLLLNLFMIALVAAVSEELFFRGVIQRALHDATNNAHVSIWIAAILFSAIHGQFYGFIPRMVLGALFGYLFLWSGSLWLPIICHFINNGAAVLFSYLSGKNIITFDADTVGTVEGENTVLFLSVMITGVLIFLIYKTEKMLTE